MPRHPLNSRAPPDSAFTAGFRVLVPVRQASDDRVCYRRGFCLHLSFPSHAVSPIAGSAGAPTADPFLGCASISMPSASAWVGH